MNSFGAWMESRFGPGWREMEAGYESAFNSRDLAECWDAAIVAALGCLEDACLSLCDDPTYEACKVVGDLLVNDLADPGE